MSRLDCYGTAISAFSADKLHSKVTKFQMLDFKSCDDNLTNWMGVMELLGNMTLGMAHDFSAPLRTLPGALFPCTKTKMEWAPSSQIGWDVLTSTTAFLGTLVFVVIRVLQYFHESKTKPSRSDSSIQPHESVSDMIRLIPSPG